MKERGKQAVKITVLGFCINIFLAFFKIIAGTIGKSSAMIADGIHSFSDFASDIVVLFSFKAAEKPADDNHNYGHGRFETLSEIFISIMLVLVGIGLAISGIEKFLQIANGKNIPSPKIVAFLAAIVSIISKEILFRCTKKVGEKINSQAVVANAWHHRSDALSSIATAIGIGGAMLFGHKWVILDPIAAIFVSFLIIKTGIKIFLGSINEFLEASISEDKKKKIIEIASSVKGVSNPHDLRAAKIGNTLKIDLHINVSPQMTVLEAHYLSTIVEEKVKQAFENQIFISVHIEPEE